MIKEKADTSHVDVLRTQLENRIWEEKEREQAMQVEAREFLMKQVDAGRKAQIEDMALREEDERVAGIREVAEYNAANAAVNQLEDEKAEMLRLMRMENMHGIKKQQHEKKVVQGKDKQREFLESKMLVHHEADHMATLSEQAGNVRLYRPLKHTNWYT